MGRWLYLYDHGATCCIAPWYDYYASDRHHRLRLASTIAPTRLGRVAEANYVISAFFRRQTRKGVRIIVPWDITIRISFRIDCRHTWECPLGINPEGIKTVSGIFQEYAERLLNECGFTKFGFRVLSAPYSGRQVLADWLITITLQHFSNCQKSSNLLTQN